MNRLFALLTCLSALYFNTSAFAAPLFGGRDIGGGDTYEMRTQQAISSTQLEDLLANNGLKIKEQLLLPLVRMVSVNKLRAEGAELTDVARVYETMQLSPVPLEDDIRYSVYSTSETCLPGKSASTQQQNFAQVCLNVERILVNKTDLPSLVGLLMHEHARHYAGRLNFDYFETVQYKLANYFRSILENKSVAVDSIISSFTHRRAAAFREESPNFDNKEILVKSALVRRRANLVCRELGFLSADAESIDIVETSNTTLPVMSLIHETAAGKLRKQPIQYLSWGLADGYSVYRFARLTCLYPVKNLN